MGYVLAILDFTWALSKQQEKIGYAAKLTIPLLCITDLHGLTKTRTEDQRVA